MKLENYEVHLPSYSIGDKIYEKIGPVCESYGKRVLVIGGRKALAAAYDKIAAYVAQTVQFPISLCSPDAPFRQYPQTPSFLSLTFWVRKNGAAAA